MDENRKKSLYDHCMDRQKYHLLEQWDVELNTGITPRDVSFGSHNRVWWRCSQGHSWQSPVFSRTSSATGCPYCSGKRVIPNYNSLAILKPELASQWHPEKNYGLTPWDVTPGSKQNVWWICEKGHEWEARVNSRTGGTGCPVCANRTLQSGENDLETMSPELARQWHPTKNGALMPKDVLAGARRKVWWRCEKGHEWQASIFSRSAQQRGCPVCAGKQVIPGENDLSSQYPAIAAQWHPEKNGALTPRDVTAFSNRKAWWQCELGHEYLAIIAHRTGKSSGCPYCSGRKVLPGFNDLATVNPEVAAQWCPELNGTLTPQMVTPGSKKRVWWKCSEGHVWTAVIYSRTGARKCGCPVCAGNVNQVRARRYARFTEEGLRRTGTASLLYGAGRREQLPQHHD